MGIIALGQDLNRSLERFNGFCVQLWTLFGIMGCFSFVKSVCAEWGALEQSE